MKWTVADSNDTGAVGKVGYALEYPNTALIVKPIDNRVIVCGAKAASAPPAGPYNWVSIPWPGWTSTESSYGTVEVTESGGSYDFNVMIYDLNGNPIGTTLESGYTFSDGKLKKLGSHLKVFLTPSGAYIGDNGPDRGGFIGMAKQTVDTADLAAHEYRGVLFQYNPATGSGDTSAVGAEPHPTISGAIRGFSYTDIENNVRETGGVTLEFGAPDSSGILTGTFFAPSGSIPFKMVAAQINGKYMVFGLSATNGYSLNFIVIQQ